MDPEPDPGCPKSDKSIRILRIRIRNIASRSGLCVIRVSLLVSPCIFDLFSFHCLGTDRYLIQGLRGLYSNKKFTKAAGEWNWIQKLGQLKNNSKFSAASFHKEVCNLNSEFNNFNESA
jgi:hypothetical protein